jgi:hypothetical protein
MMLSHDPDTISNFQILLKTIPNYIIQYYIKINKC